MSDQNSSEKNEKQDQQAEQAPQPPAPQPQQFQGQPQQYQQFQGQAYQQPQGQYAPSAHSAPQMAYGYAPQSQKPSAIATMFSPSFATKGGQGLAKIVMLLAIVAFGIFAAYQLFALIDLLSLDGQRGMRIVSALFGFVFEISKALVVLGGIRLLLERVPSEDTSGN
ncbi:MAG: hypothetical protein Q4P33_07155 [Flaviflexus sp.]|nr:hypothetical protein [Flaviflexus sp.]